MTIKELKTFEDSKQAISLFQKWGKTKGLIISDPEQQLKKFWDLQNSGFEKTFLAFKEEQLVSSITISHFNNIVVPIQVLNSYSSIARNLGGPALTWYAIKWSKEFKFAIYDITGGPLLPENEQVNDKKRPFSLIHYKKKWGGKQYIHYHFIKINKKSSYVIYKKLFKMLQWYHNRKGSSDDMSMD